MSGATTGQVPAAKPQSQSRVCGMAAETETEVLNLAEAESPWAEFRAPR